LRRSNNETTAGWVYFIECGEGGPVKVGWARDPRARRKELQVASPYPLKLVGAKPGTVRDERSIHYDLSETRLRGEWFKRSDELEELIKNCPYDDKRKFSPTAMRMDLKVMRIESGSYAVFDNRLGLVLRVFEQPKRFEGDGKSQAWAWIRDHSHLSFDDLPPYMDGVYSPVYFAK